MIFSINPVPYPTRYIQTLMMRAFVFFTAAAEASHRDEKTPTFVFLAPGHHDGMRSARSRKQEFLTEKAAELEAEAGRYRAYLARAEARDREASRARKTETEAKTAQEGTAKTRGKSHKKRSKSHSKKK